MLSSVLGIGSIRPAYCFFIALAATLWLAFIDRITGPSYRLTVFYLILVGFTAWYAWRWQAAIIAFASACFGVWADGVPLSNPAAWNIGVWLLLNYLGVYLIGALCVHALRRYWSQAHVLARTDEISGLPNNRMFMDRLRTTVCQSITRQMPFTLVYLDLDDFRQVNRLHGFDFGDRVLRAVGNALRELCGPADTACRLRSDQFALLCDHVDREATMTALDALKQALGNLPERLPTSAVVGMLDGGMQLA